MTEIIIKKFNELTLDELYDILKLRNEIFIVEQNCPYQDIDDNDKEAIHFMLKKNEKLIGYIRVLPKGLTYETSAIGRVIVSITERGNSYASLLVQEGLNYITDVWKENEAMLGAQVYALNLYKSLGFKVVSSEYLEDDIPHVDMLYTHK